jgi:hypothetical protein
MEVDFEPKKSPAQTKPTDQKKKLKHSKLRRRMQPQSNLLATKPLANQAPADPQQMIDTSNVQ